MVHHTADLPAGVETGRTDEQRVQSIYRYHARTLGDIGYNAIIGTDGTIYEGKRGQGGAKVLEDGVVGAHAFGFNRHTFSVSLLGNFNNGPMPKPMRDALIHLLPFEAQKWGIDPESKIEFVRTYHHTLSEADKKRVPKVDADVPAIEGHGKLPRQCTDCPGSHVKADLEQIRADVAEYIRTHYDIGIFPMFFCALN